MAVRKTGKTIVRFLTEGKRHPGAKVSSLDFNGKNGEVAVDGSGPVRHVLVGLGKAPRLAELREGVHKAMTLLRKTGTTEAHIVAPASLSSKATSTTNFFGPKAFPIEADHLQQMVVQWSHMSLFSDERQKSVKDSKPVKLTFGSDEDSLFEKVITTRGAIIADAVNAARMLGNDRPEVCSPQHFASKVVQLSRLTAKSKRKLTVRHVLNEKSLVSKGLNLHYAVGKGAVRPPRLVVLEYNGNPKSSSTTAVVGKGITMDTGGLNIKPFGSMETMHLDMMGAGAVYGLTKAVAQMQLPVNLVSVFALAENACGNRAYMPSSIIKSLKGSTVEITNTDAEGRLVLADAITFVQDHARLKTRVDYVIDVATLTGACMVALGNERAGLFSNNYGMVDTLVLAGEEVGEPVWPLPITADHEKKMKGSMSDLINCTPDRYAGACTAAAFLKHFVNPEVQWAHLDIAGPGCLTKGSKINPAGATGYGVNLLVRYFEKLAQR